jgi:phage-related minor tail protein
MGSLQNMVERHASKIEQAVEELRQADDFDEMTKLADGIGDEVDRLADRLTKASEAFADDDDTAGEGEEEAVEKPKAKGRKQQPADADG